MAELQPLYPWLVWIVPLLGAVLTPGVARVSGRARDYFAVAVSLLSALFTSLMLPFAYEGGILHHQVPWISVLNTRAGILADSLSIIMANIVGWISFLIMFYSLGYMKGEPNLTRYWFFMNFFIGNMQLIVLSDNFLQLFFGWEGVGLASYALIGFWHTDERKYWVGTPGHTAWGLEQAYSPSDAGMKALITTRIGDVAFLIGIFLLFTFSGTFEFTALTERAQWARDLARLGLFVPVGLLIFGGAIGKSAQFPLQEWLPDAMAGPTAVSALIHAATMVKAGVFLVARVGPIFLNAARDVLTVAQVVPFFETIAWIGAVTAFLAASQAMVAKEVKKVLAYSTVSQIGYMMLGLGAAGLTASFAFGFTAGMFHLTSHAVFKASLFMAAGAVLHATETKYLQEMGGLRPHMRITFVAMMLAGLSLAGVPFFSGFWSKDAVLTTILLAAAPSSLPLFLVAVGTAVLTGFYTLRLLGLIFFGRKSEHLEQLEREGHHLHEAPAVMWAPYAVLAALSLGIGLIGPVFEARLEHVFDVYLAKAYHVESVLVDAANLTAVAGSVLALALGGGLGYYVYLGQRLDPARTIAASRVLQGLYRFLENRWYLNPAHYKIFVVGSARAATGLFNHVETDVIDRFNNVFAQASILFASLGHAFDQYVVDGFVNGLARASQWGSGVSRRIQAGVTELYVLAFASGIILVVLFLLYLAVAS